MNAPNNEPGDRAPSVEATASSLRMASLRLARGLRQHDDLGLSPTLRAALGTISREGPITLGTLAAIEQVAPPSITKITGKLVDAGYIVRRVHESDRRIVTVELTAEGRRQIAATREHGNTWLVGLLADRSPAELAGLRDAAALLLQLLATDEPQP
jgi:DNA-binding MarR family transcriptional regulator